MPLKIIRPGQPRAYTNALLEMVDEGVLDKDTLIQSLLGWMDEGEVKEFCNANYRDEYTNKPIIGPALCGRR
jgi:hypothetical protein